MNEELQSSATESAEQQTETEPQAQPGESVQPEETEEEKNKRVLAEAQEQSRARAERKQQRVQARFDELTAARYAAEREAKAAREMNERLLAIVEGKKGDGDGEPTRDKFESYEDFVAARAEWRAEQKAQATVKQAIEQFQRTTQESAKQTSAQAERQAVEREFLKNRAEAEKAYPDYEEVLADWEPKGLPDSVSELILRLPEGPKVAYHLAKNPDLEAQFRDAPAHMHGVLMGQLIATLKTSPTTTKAAPPGKPAGAKPTSSSNGEYTGSPDGYYEWARKNMK